MIFKEEDVLTFFLKKRIVATMRNGKYGLMIGEEIDVFDGSGKPIGRAKVKAVFENVPTFRKLLVRYSGFNDVKEWEKTAKNLHNGKIPKYIVLLQFTGINQSGRFEEINEIIYDIARNDKGDDEV